jgi:membrane fusion protein, multidrug efflux system
MAQVETLPPRHQEEEELPEFQEPRSRSEQMREHLRSNPRTRIILILAALALLAGGYGVWHYYSVRESTDDAQIEGDIVPISPRVGGTVKAVYAEDNQYVEAGTVLAELDPTDYLVAQRRAEAELADAAANAQAARTGVPITSTTTSSQLQIAQANLVSAQRQAEAARARLAEAQANHRRAAQDLARFKQLVEKDEISRQQYDTAVAAETAARAAVDSAQAAVAAADAKVTEQQAQVKAASVVPEQLQVTRAKAGAAEATVQKNQAAVEQAKLNAGYTVLRAPVAGIVSKKTVQIGQIVQPGQPLMSVVPVQNVWVVANFKENQLKKMRVNQPVKIHVDAYDKDFNGHVDSIGGATAARFSLLPPENATGNYVKVVQRVPVKIVFEQGHDPQHLLRPGMSVVPTVRVN